MKYRCIAPFARPHGKQIFIVFILDRVLMRNLLILYSVIFSCIFYSEGSLAYLACHHGLLYGEEYNKSDMQLRAELYSKYRELDRLYETGLSNRDKEVKAIIADIDALMKKLQNCDELSDKR